MILFGVVATEVGTKVDPIVETLLFVFPESTIWTMELGVTVAVELDLIFLAVDMTEEMRTEITETTAEILKVEG